MVRQRFDLNYSVAGFSDVGRRHKQNVINSSDSGTANLEVYVRSTDHECRLIVVGSRFPKRAHQDE